MSDVMLFGILRMPYELAMDDELSRFQFYRAAQEAADRIEYLDEDAPAPVALTDKEERAAFEAWARGYISLLGNEPFERQGDGYKWNSVNQSWAAWKARALLARTGETK